MAACGPPLLLVRARRAPRHLDLCEHLFDTGRCGPSARCACLIVDVVMSTSPARARAPAVGFGVVVAGFGRAVCRGPNVALLTSFVAAGLALRRVVGPPAIPCTRGGERMAFQPWEYRTETTGPTSGADLSGYSIAAVDGDIGHVDKATIELSARRIWWSTPGRGSSAAR